MVETSARLLRLLSVLQSQSHWSGNDLAHRLEVTQRTLRRDVDRLRSLGYVIDATSGPGGGYRLGQGTRMPPLLLADEEAIAVAVALRAAADTLGLGETAVAVLAKLEQLLPSRLRRRVSALHAMTVTVSGTPPAFDVAILVPIAAACRDHEELAFDYRDRAGEPSARRVEPLRLALTGNRRFYLVAWDIERAAWRTFRIDRIVGVPRPGKRFLPREPPADIAAYVSDSITRGVYRHRARVVLLESAKTVAATIPPWVGKVTPIDDTRCELATGADSIEALACQLMLARVSFELVEPEDLRAPLLQVARRLSRSLAAK